MTNLNFEDSRSVDIEVPLIYNLRRCIYFLKMADTSQERREKISAPEESLPEGAGQVETGVQSGVDLRVGEEVSKRVRNVEGVEDAEGVGVFGRVSEDESSVSDKDLGASGGSTGSMDPVKRREYLMQNMPPEAKMRREVAVEIKREINLLTKEVMKMKRSPYSEDYHRMANAMAKIRILKGVLTGLVKASFDTVKTLWLRYVHGVM